MDIINIPMGYVIRFCNNLVGNNYFLALLLFAIIIEIILLPFGIKQQKNSIKQAKLRPKEMAIRKKYAGREDQVSKQKMSQEIQEFYQKEGYNPMGGCLPMLIQFPVIIALYNIVMNPLHYICKLSEDAINQIIAIVQPYYPDVTFTATRNIDLLGAMRKLNNPSLFSSVEGFTEKVYEDLPNLEMFGGAIDLSAIPKITEFSWLLLVPVLTFLAYFFSMKMTRKLTYQPQADDPAMGCSNKMMDIMMPLFSVYISFVVPAAIGVYWIFKSLLGVVKQVILKHAMPIPTFTEEDYKAAEKAMNTNAKPVKTAKSGKVVRSLHHIDDEDFEDTREAAIARRKLLEEAEQKENEGKKPTASEEDKSSLLSGVSLKNDDRAPKEKKAKKEKKNKDEGYNTSDGSDKHDKSEQ